MNTTVLVGTAGIYKLHRGLGLGSNLGWFWTMTHVPLRKSLPHLSKKTLCQPFSHLCFTFSFIPLSLSLSRHNYFLLFSLSQTVVQEKITLKHGMTNMREILCQNYFSHFVSLGFLCRKKGRKRAGQRGSVRVCECVCVCVCVCLSEWVFDRSFYVHICIWSWRMSTFDIKRKKSECCLLLLLA